MGNENRNFIVVIEISTIGRNASSPSRRYVDDFPAALAYVKACCSKFDITDFMDDSFTCISDNGATMYLIMKEYVDNYFDIRDEYPNSF